MIRLGRNYREGAIAGAEAGIVLGGILTILYYALFTLLSSTIKPAIQGGSFPAGTTVDQAFNLTLIAVVSGVLAGSIVGGAILGGTFAAYYEKYLKSQSLTVRGLVFGIGIWSINLLPNINNFYFGATFVTLYLLIDLVGSLIYGYLLGAFYGRVKVRLGSTRPL